MAWAFETVAYSAVSKWSLPAKCANWIYSVAA
jgi:hypothetical protein